MRFLTVCKVTFTFDPHFERAKKEQLPLLTPTENYENNDNNHKSDAPYREITPFLRLLRCRGMRHIGKVGIALTGCVAHRNKQGKRTAPFSGVGNANACGEVSPLSRGHPLTPVQNIC